MLERIAIYLSEDITSKYNKMGIAFLHLVPEKVVCIINHCHAGRSIREFYPFLEERAIVGSLSDAIAMDANTLLFGLAAQGGVANKEHLALMQQALDANLRVINGFHVSPELQAMKQATGDRFINLREPAAKYLVKNTGKLRERNNKRVLMVGTDMAVGKMTAAFLFNKKAQQRGLHSEFLATGQIGIAISGKGVPLDAVALDFSGGAVETLVVESDAELVFIEGQGSIINPSSSAVLPLIRGALPTHFILCHDASLTYLEDFDYIKIPPLDRVIDLYETVAEACGLFPKPETVGICVNTAKLTESAALAYREDLEQKTGKIVLDPVRNADKLDLIIQRIVEEGGSIRI